VKHPVARDKGVRRTDLYSDIATELQVFRRQFLKDHANIAYFYGMMYYDAEDEIKGLIVPALVMGYAEYGSVETYQELGYARSVLDKILTKKTGGMSSN
jgi:hypothetical protein